MTQEKNNSPFAPARRAEKKYKIFVWGPSGSGKTTLGLSFPSPALIDLEGGADLYGNRAAFSVVKTTDLRTIANAVRWLGSGEHTHETLVVDPISVYWEETQRYWQTVFLAAYKGTKADKKEFFELGPKEWAKIKDSYKLFLSRLMALNMNVVVTARAKTKYREGAYMIADGECPDAERNTEYAFDLVLRMTEKNGEYITEVTKDRTGTLPKTLKTSEIIKHLFQKKEKK